MSLLSPQLQAFIAIARSKTVHGAAKELGITQTGVTQRLRTLEQSLGTTLFTRSRRGMLLTHEGQALLRYCQGARELEGEALAQITGAAVGKPVRVTITGPTSILRARVIPACIPVLQRLRELHAHFRLTDIDSWIDELRTGEAQLAAVPAEQVARELESKRLKPERFLLLGPKAWRRRDLVDIVRNERIIDFDPTDRMSFNYLKKFGLHEHARADRHFVNSNESLGRMIEAGLGYGVFTIEFADRFLKKCDLVALNEGRSLDIPMALAWYHRPARPKYWTELLTAIR